MESYYFKQAQFTLIVVLSILSAQLKLNAQGCTPPNIISTIPGSRCGVGTTTLAATGDPGSVLNWYTSPAGGASVGTGTMFTTPTLTNTSNFYVAASVIGGTVTVTKTLGAGASANTGTAYNLTNGYYGGLKAQYLYRASELAAAGISAGNITSLKFDLTTAGSNLNGFAVQMGTTALTAFASANIQGGLSTVYPAATFTPVVGANTMSFATPFYWDGTSNIIISFSWSNNNTGNTASTIKYDATSFNASQMYRRDNFTPTNMLAFTGSAGGGTSDFQLSQDRPAFTLVTTSICESPRTLVAAVINTPPTLALTTSTAVCPNVTKPLSVTSNLSDYNSYIWSPVTNLCTDAAATTPYTGGSATTLYYKATASSNMVYTINATNSANGCNVLATTTITTSPPVINASVSPTVVCSGSPVNLNATTNVLTTGTVAIGNGTSITDGTAFEPTAFSNTNGSYRLQTIYTAAELYAAGLRVGNITSITYNIATIGGSATNANYTVKCGTTTATTFTDFLPSTGFTTVFPATSYTHAVGLNTINFTTPYPWDGISNLIIDVSYNVVNTNSSAKTYYTQTSGNTVVFAMNGNTTNSGNLDNMRLNIIFTGQTPNQGAGSYTWQWNPGAINTNTAVVNPINTGTNPLNSSYTVTGMDPVTTCSNSAVVSVLVNPIPASPVAVNSTQCGLGIPTASVSGATNYRWYATPTSTTVLQAGTSTNFTTAINATTTWYVSSYNTNCESTRTAVTTTVVPADAITAISTSTAICPGQSFSLTASPTGTTTTYQYTWTATPAIGSGIPASVGSATTAVTPTDPGSYKYLVTAINGACTATASVNVRLNDSPRLITTISPTLVCSGSPANLNVISTTNQTVAIGNATTLTADADAVTAFSNQYASYHMQTIYTAAELNAAGLRAGNITSIAYNISTLGSASNTTNYVVKISTTAATSIFAFLSTTTFTTVYSAITQPHAVGLNTITFTTPYNWDGVSNLVVDVSHNGANSGNNARTYYTSTANTQMIYQADAILGITLNRLNILFGGQVVAQTGTSIGWQWNPGAINSNTAIVNPVNTGTNVSTVTYTVTGTNLLTACSNTAAVTVTVNPLPNMPTVFNSTQCGLGIPTASVSGGTTYNWYATNTSTAVLQSGAAANYTTAINATTTWYVSSYNGTCESARAAITETVTVPDAITATITSTAVCLGTPFTLSATSTGTNNNTYTYTWTSTPATGSGMTTSIAGATTSVMPTTAGTYAYIVRGVAGVCTATAAVNVTAKALPVMNASASPSVICSGSSVTLNASNGIQWNPGAINSTTAVVTPTTGATSSTVVYTVTAINPVTTCSNTAAVSVTVNPATTVSVTASMPTVCSGTSATLTASGATTYNWMPAGGTAATAIVSPASATVYTITGSSLGCSSTKTIGIGVTPSPTVIASASSSVICAGAAVSLTANGATNYTWTPMSVMTASTTVSPTLTTTYSVTGVSGGCSVTKAVSVTVNTVPTITVTTNPSGGALCTTGATATLTAAGTSTAYVWSTGAATASTSVAPTATTVYTVTATNSCGTSTATSMIAVGTMPTISTAASSSLICTGNAALLTATGTATSYSWSTGATTTSISVSPTVTTTYTVSGTNVCGTTATTVIQFVLLCTGVEESSTSASISIYPNPANENISIAIPAYLASAGTILEVTDALGKLVMKESLHTEVTTLRLTNLGDGVYFFKVINNNEVIKIGKVVKW